MMRRGTANYRARLKPGLALAALMLSVSGCASVRFERVGPGEAPTVLGPPVRSNFTPFEPAFACLANEIDEAGRPKLVIAVGNVSDYTGKFNINEGNAITQGGSLMVESALGKLDGAVTIADRYNTSVAQMELTFLNQRELGDRRPHKVQIGKLMKQVPWLPYYGGSIVRSKYFITGGITELNYNIQSGGAQFTENLLGPKARVFTENIGVDLQIVNTRTLLVAKTVSLEKQLTGYEVGFNVFRFFGSDLFDVNIGNKSQEPLQLGVRSVLEDGVLKLVSAVERVPVQPCLSRVSGWIPRETSAQILRTQYVQPAGGTAPTAPDTVPSPAAAPLPAPPSRPLKAPLQNGIMTKPAHGLHVVFNFGVTTLTGADLPQIETAAQLARRHPVAITLLALVNERWPPTRRAQLTAARINAVEKALRVRGVRNIKIAWQPNITQTGTVAADGTGYQKVAILIAGT